MKKKKPAGPAPIKRYKFCVAGFAALFWLIGWTFARSSAPTYDEPVHLAAGMSYWRTGRLHLNILEHPPLAEMAAAAPLAFAPVVLDEKDSSLEQRQQYGFADRFLYNNVWPADRLLAWGRAATLTIWTLALFFFMARWAERIGGQRVALWACALTALCPPLISNAALITTDAAAAVCFFAVFSLAAEAFGGGFSGKRWRVAAWAGIFAGVGMASKYSMALIPPLVVSLAVWEGWRSPRDQRGEYWKAIAAFLGAGLITVAVAYGVLQVPLWWEGLRSTFGRVQTGRYAYALGRAYESGFWWYFPLALAVKTPLASLLCAFRGAGSVFKNRPVDWLWWSVPAAVYLFLAMRSSFSIGIRHVLPVYPFLMLIAALGAEALWRWKRWAAGAAFAWAAFSVAAAHPFQLAYFNELAGGPSGGHRVLVQSNLDWGQALPQLADELKRRGNPAVVLEYFGVAKPEFYGLRYIPISRGLDIPRSGNVATLAGSERILLAISANNRHGVYYKNHGVFKWLESRPPVWVAGHSIFLYDLTEDAEALKILALMMHANGNPKAAGELMARRAAIGGGA